MLYIDKEGFFVELIKKNIHMNKLKSKCYAQLTLDDDFNVPDIKPDIDRIVKEQGNITVMEVKPLNGKLMIKGELNFNLLYVSSEDSRPVHNIIGKLPFDEVVNMDEACATNNISVKCDLEDLSANLINSRKISVKSLLGFSCYAEDVYDEEAAIGIEDKGTTEYLTNRLAITQIAVNKKDTYRIKDEIILPSGKPNIFEVLYNELELRNVETRLSDNKISIKGDILVFLLYTSDDEEQPIQYYETESPFSGVIDCNGCDENMISDICINILSKSLEAKEDSDGESRVVDLEVVLELDVKAYQEEEIEILSDLYSTCKEIMPTYQEVCFDNILMKNNSKTRVVDHILLENTSPKVLQLCNATGVIKIDDMEVVSNGIQVDGVVDIQLMYITDVDDKPLGCAKGTIPFSILVEVKNINENCIYDVKPSIEQLNVMMLDSTDIEAKVSINLDTIVFDKLYTNIIKDVEEAELNTEHLQQMPSIIGYIVKSGDTLWNIAKRYYSTVDMIRELNELETDEINEGDKLLLLKKVDAIT